MAEPNNRYGLTAARAHGQPGRDIRPRSLTVDIHAHVQVPAAAAYARLHQTPDPRAAVYTEETRILTRMQDEDRTPNLTDLALRMRDFDAMGVDAQVISPAPPQCYYDVPHEVGIKAAGWSTRAWRRSRRRCRTASPRQWGRYRCRPVARPPPRNWNTR